MFHLSKADHLRNHSCYRRFNANISLLSTVKPKYIKVTKAGAPLKNETVEHMNEDDVILLECESGGGKPIPTVEWWNGTQKMDGK